MIDLGELYLQLTLQRAPFGDEATALRTRVVEMFRGGSRCDQVISYSGVCTLIKRVYGVLTNNELYST